MPLPALGNPHLIICEGMSDKAFFTHLLATRAIFDFDVRCPWEMQKGLEGEDGIVELLKAITMDRNFNLLKLILIFVDADDNPTLRFSKFQDALRNGAPTGHPPYPVPNAPGVIAISTNAPATVIQLLPEHNSPGAMETLCWNAGKQKNNVIETCVNQFASCIGANEWLPQKYDKFRLRSLISANAPKNPDLPITYLWDEMPKLVPLESAVFDQLANFLVQIKQQV